MVNIYIINETILNFILSNQACQKSKEVDKFQQGWAAFLDIVIFKYLNSYFFLFYD